MIAHLTRLNYLSDGIIGSLIINDVRFYTLEHAYEEPEGVFLPKIPAGQYTCIRGIHQLPGHPHSFETFEVTGVTGHTKILLHVGNSNSDSSGCILLGLGLVNDPYHQITQSKLAFTNFMRLMDSLDSFQLVVA